MNSFSKRALVFGQALAIGAAAPLLAGPAHAHADAAGLADGFTSGFVHPILG